MQAAREQREQRVAARVARLVRTVERAEAQMNDHAQMIVGSDERDA